MNRGEYPYHEGGAELDYLMAQQDGLVSQDEGPSVAEIATAVATGLLCAQCSEPFVAAHGHKVACKFCFSRMTEAEIAAEGVRLATHEESTAQAFAERARKRRNRVR